MVCDEPLIIAGGCRAKSRKKGSGADLKKKKEVLHAMCRKKASVSLFRKKNVKKRASGGQQKKRK